MSKLKAWIAQNWSDIAFVAGALALALAVVLWATGCGALKRAGLVGGGAAAGAAVGSLAGPAGAIGGAAVGGAVTSSVVESDKTQDRVDELEGRMYPTAPGLVPAPSIFGRVAAVPWWTWLVLLWLYLRRAHIADALTGKEPRLDAILRALGLRTHKTPRPVFDKTKGDQP